MINGWDLWQWWRQNESGLSIIWHWVLFDQSTKLHISWETIAFILYLPTSGNLERRLRFSVALYWIFLFLFVLLFFLLFLCAFFLLSADDQPRKIESSMRKKRGKNREKNALLFHHHAVFRWKTLASFSTTLSTFRLLDVSSSLNALRYQTNSLFIDLFLHLLPMVVRSI